MELCRGGRRAPLPTGKGRCAAVRPTRCRSNDSAKRLQRTMPVKLKERHQDMRSRSSHEPDSVADRVNRPCSVLRHDQPKVGSAINLEVLG